MDFLKEWEEKLAIKITCSQASGPASCSHGGAPWGACTNWLTQTECCYRLTLWVYQPVLQEKEPMGTAGPLALANEILNDGSGDPFFVLNRCAPFLIVGDAQQCTVSCPDPGGNQPRSA